MIDLTKIRPFVDLAIRAAGMAGADSPAFTKVTGGISQLLGILDPSDQREKVRFDAGLRDAIKARKDAFDNAHDAGAARPK